MVGANDGASARSAGVRSVFHWPVENPAARSSGGVVNGAPWYLHSGDAAELLARLPPCSVDCCISDPPYGLSGARPALEPLLRAWMSGESAEAHTGRAGFMGAAWDSFVPGPETWRAVFRVLRLGALLAAFAAPRTYHYTAIAAELAGFEIRDLAEWLCGQGKPSGRRVSGSGPTRHSGLKPAHEPILIARKPLAGPLDDNVREHGTGAYNVDAARVPMPGQSYGGKREGSRADSIVYNLAAAPMRSSYERKNHPLGRWPANVLHDGSPGLGPWLEIHGAPPAAPRFWYNAKASTRERERGLEPLGDWRGRAHDGRAAVADNQFQRGASLRRNIHPTVKPVRLLRYLVRLLCPAAGVVLDPFTGSGSTGVAAVLEGRRFVGAELDTRHATISALRIAHALEEPEQWADTDTRAHYAAAAKAAACARAREDSRPVDPEAAPRVQSNPLQLGLL